MKRLLVKLEKKKLVQPPKYKMNEKRNEIRRREKTRFYNFNSES